MKSNLKKEINSEIQNFQNNLLFPSFNKTFNHLGDIQISSGKLIVADPSSEISKLNTLKEEFPIGKYPVYYFRKENAGVLVIFERNKTPEKWKTVVFETDTKEKIDKFWVGSGSLCVMDFDALKYVVENESLGIYPNGFWNEEVYARFEMNQRAWGFDIAVANSMNNIVVSLTEWGDSLYKSYLGYDKSGKILCLYIDLGPAKLLL